MRHEFLSQLQCYCKRQDPGLHWTYVEYNLMYLLLAMIRNIRQKLRSNFGSSQEEMRLYVSMSFSCCDASEGQLEVSGRHFRYVVLLSKILQ